MRTVRSLLALAAAFAAIPSFAAPPSVGGCAILPANNYWNTPVDTLPLHPSSAAWVASVGNTARLHADWGNVLADNYGIPFVTVPGTQPFVPILPAPDEAYEDESDPGPYPIPPNAPIEGGPASTGDRHVLVIETTNCVLYELYRATPVNGGAAWTATSWAKWPLGSNALRPAGWTSADAAGLPIFPGLVRYDEVLAGEIAHAIRFTAVNIWGRDATTGARQYLWPARHWSGNGSLSTRPPMGARFRLKASFDVTPYSPETQVILRAFKKYGLVLADGGSNWFFQGVSDTRWPDDVFSELGSIAGSNFEVVDTSVLQVNPNSAQAQLPQSTLTVTKAGAGAGTVTSNPAGISCGATCASPFNRGSAVTLTAAASGGSVFAGWTGGGCAGTGACAVTLAADTSVSATFVPQAGTPTAAIVPSPLDFGAQSMGTTSPAIAAAVTNVGTGTLTVTSVSVDNAQFAQANTCTSLAAGASCTVNVSFSPLVTAGTLLSSTPVAGNLLVASNGTGSPNAASLTGTGEKSLVTHYYRSILRRAADSGGKAFWESEATRLAGLQANVNETWFAMATFFYFSPEYAAFGRTDTQFVSDLYNTFFNRPADSGGLAFWTGQIAAGVPREIILVSFMFSTEFQAFAQGIFGNTAARKEVDTVVDFYRGILSRLPDTGGYNFWVQQFRTAQCTGAAAVNTQVEAISSAFMNGSEYAARNRTNAQFVGDLYNAFLRRGGDQAGVLFWIGQLNGGATRNSIRQQFIASGEFQGRVAAIIAQGCLP